MAECSICLSTFSAEGPCVPYVLECAHSLCFSCLETGRIDRCPTCRFAFSRRSAKKNFSLIDALGRLNNDKERCSKCKFALKEDTIRICVTCSLEEDSEWMKKPNAKERCSQFQLCGDCIYENHISLGHFVSKISELQLFPNMPGHSPHEVSMDREKPFDDARKVASVFSDLTPANLESRYMMWIRLNISEKKLFEVTVDCLFNVAASQSHLCDELSWIFENEIRQRKNFPLRDGLMSHVLKELDVLSVWMVGGDSSVVLSEEMKKEMLGTMRFIGGLFGSAVLHSSKLGGWMCKLKNVSSQNVALVSDLKQFSLLCAMEISISYMSQRRSSNVYEKCAQFVCHILSLRHTVSDSTKAKIEKLAMQYKG